MTTLWPRIAATLLCSLPAVAMSDSAECAWVLWVAGHFHGEVVPSYPYQSPGTLQEGNEAGNRVHVPKDNTGYSARPLCLPDTVDPRGMKSR